MEKEKSAYYLAAKKIWETVVDTDSPDTFELKLQLDFHKRLLNIFQVGNYYYLIFNIYQAEIEYISPGITEVLGYAQEEITVEFFMSKIHPEDKPYFLQYEYQVAHFFKGLPFEKIKSYKVQYDYRVKNKDNK